MTEPNKELLKIADILEWIPGVTRYQVDALVEAGALEARRLPGMKHRFFHKEDVRKAFLRTEKPK